MFTVSHSTQVGQAVATSEEDLWQPVGELCEEASGRTGDISQGATSSVLRPTQRCHRVPQVPQIRELGKIQDVYSRFELAVVRRDLQHFHKTRINSCMFPCFAVIIMLAGEKHTCTYLNLRLFNHFSTTALLWCDH